MREELAKRDGFRGVFTATYERPGSRSSRGWTVHTLLFVHVCDSHGNEVTDHIWFTKAEGWTRLQLARGDRVQFTARVRPYWKGYHDCRRMDYRLSHPRDIRVFCTPAPDGAAPLHIDPAQPELFS